MSDDANEIAKRLGTAFAVATARFLPAVIEGLQADADAELSFGTTVRLRNVEGVVEGTMQMFEPKIPTQKMKAVPFVLNRNQAGELSWLYEGTLKELKEEAARNAAALQPDDGYEPQNNRLSKEETGGSQEEGE